MKAGVKKKNFDPAGVFAVLALLIGGLYCLAIPYGAGFDEERHMVRIYDLSGGYLLPNHNPPSFKSTTTLKEFADLSYQRRFTQSPAFDMFSSKILELKLSHQESDLVYGYVGGSIYSPVIFLPQALIARLFWRKFDFPILPVMFLMRFAGLMVYVAGAWLAIRLLPTGRWILTVLALAPMALFQAATFNADGFTNVASFLFIGTVLHVYADDAEKVQPHWVWALIGCAFWLGVAKPGAVILLPLLLILTGKQFTSRKWIMILGTGAVSAFLINVGWISIALPNSKFAAGGSDSLSRQFGLVLAHPIDFLVTYALGTLHSFLYYFKDWTAAYGYWAGEVPGPVYPLFALLLLIIILVEPRSNIFTKKARLIMAGAFLLASASIMTVYFITYYTPGNAGALGRHGRYFIAFTPLFFIAITGLFQVPDHWKPLMQGTAVVAFLAVIGFYSFGIYTTYYTVCGYQAYVGGKCGLPIYKNIEKEGIPEIKVNTTTTVSQTFTSQCNGLEAVQVFVNSVPTNRTGSITLSLLDENQHKLAGKNISISDITAFDYLTLPVSPAAGSRGSNFEIQLEASNLTAPNALGLGYIAGDFHNGELLAAQQVIRGDLIYHYICTHP
jgi:hypothetical protein